MYDRLDDHKSDRYWILNALRYTHSSALFKTIKKKDQRAKIEIRMESEGYPSGWITFLKLIICAGKTKY